MINLKKFTKIKIDPKLCPRDYFEAETKHLMDIGAKATPGVGTGIAGLYEGRLYFNDKETMRIVIAALKSIGVPVVVECNLTRIVMYTDKEKELLSYYLKGRGVDCQGVFWKFD